MPHKNIILYVGGFELPDKNAAAHRVVANAKIFKSLGYETAFLGVDKTLSAASDVLSTHQMHFGFDSWAQPYPSGRKAWFSQITSIKDVKTLIDGPLAGRVHSIVCYNYPAIAMLRLRGLCKTIGAHFLSDATEWSPKYAGSFIYASVKGLDTALRMKFVNKRADGLILSSPYLARYYAPHCNNCVVLPTLYDRDVLWNAVPQNDKTGHDGVAGSNQKGERDAVRFLYAGSLFIKELVDADRANVKDRTDQVIELFSQLYSDYDNFHLDIVGLPKDNFLFAFPDFKAKLEALGERVIFHGRKPHAAVIAMLKDADFTIFIRNLNRQIEAGFPSKFSESMTYGTPVICNIYSSIETYVREGENHYALPLGDQDGQLAVMRNILDQPPSDRARMKAYCRDNPIFDYRAFADVTADFFAKLNAKKGDTAP